MAMQPLILTLRINEEAFLFFDELRQRYFPPERNFLKAHLTLFHHLPPDVACITEEIEQLCSEQQQFTLLVSAVVHIGRGVAYKVESAQLQALHLRLQQSWSRWLIPQDKQKLWPHITVQNKVPSDAARLLQQQLATSFEPFYITGLGLDLWAYLGGPWQWLETYPFQVLPEVQ